MNIFIGNLSKGTTVEELEKTFSTYGTVDSCRIIKDIQSGESKGFGFVEMTDKPSANNAIKELNNLDLNGRKITVNEARPKNPDRSTSNFRRY